MDYVRPKEEVALLPNYVRHCLECFTRIWKVVEFSHRISVRIERNLMSVSVYQQEFEVDQDFSSLDDTLVYQSESCTPSSRQSIASLSSVSTLVSSTDTLTPRGSWASFDLRSSANDPLIEGILDRIQPENIDQINETKRAEDRQNSLFGLYPDLDTDEMIEKRPPAEAPHEHAGNRIYVKCHHLKLDLEVEPIFASVAVYDAREKKKISENFYFDVNPESLKRMLNTHIPYSDPSTLARSAIFEMTHPSHDLFLVIRLEKVLQGDTKDSIEPYLKDKEDKDKFRDKMKSTAADYCERLGKYRMPFAWTGIYLNPIFSGESYDASDRDSIGTSCSSNSLDRKSSTSSFEQLKKRAADMGTLSRRGSLERRSEKRRSWSPEDFANCVESFRPISITVSSFFKQEADKMRDEDLFKFLPELKRLGSVVKKYKCIPGSIKFEISPYPMELENCLTPELVKVEPFTDENTRPTREILEFPIAPIYNPHYAYRNLLYISPKELNFSARAGSSRNIAVRVQLMAGERQTDALPNIFGKSSCPEFSSEAYTIVNYHNKTPVFYDEFKILLPADLRQNHHILFTIFHISCQKKPLEEQKTVETPIGYTWLPILKDGRLNIGEHQLPVMVEEPPVNYSYIPALQLPG